jgi:hypothetical protein
LVQSILEDLSHLLVLLRWWDQSTLEDLLRLLGQSRQLVL